MRRRKWKSLRRLREKPVSDSPRAYVGTSDPEKMSNGQTTPESPQRSLPVIVSIPCTGVINAFLLTTEGLYVCFLVLFPLSRQLAN
jgi:hypothetical protein